jgi:hypothetical protein
MGSEARKPPFQFSLRSLLVLTVAVAACFSVLRVFEVLEGPDALAALWWVLLVLAAAFVLMALFVLIVAGGTTLLFNMCSWIWNKARRLLRTGGNPPASNDEPPQRASF